MWFFTDPLSNGIILEINTKIILESDYHMCKTF
jgi:hypothetical protein